MNGLWSGWYSYEGLGQAVPFTAWIDDTGGLLLGTILEPNTFSPLDLDDLQADLSGTRDGQAVFFSKVYSDDQGAHASPILYGGEADARFERVMGRWSFPHLNGLEGRFELTRSSRGIGEGVLRKVFAQI